MKRYTYAVFLPPQQVALIDEESQPMGPYCEFCATRCFTHMPMDTPAEALAAYRPGVTIIATCPAGQKYERQVTGWCYEKIMRAIAEARND